MRSAPPSSERGNPAQFIDFVKASGVRQAFPYGQLIWIVSESPAKVTFHFASHTVSVAGYRLAPIYELAVAQQLGSVLQTDARYASDEEAGPVVTEIHVVRVERSLTEADQDIPLDPEAEGG